MANDINRQTVLFALLDQAAIPWDGISVSDINATPPAVSISYKPAATAEQIALGNQILAAFDWRRRRALARNTIVTALQSLTVAERQAVQLHLVAQMLRDNPTAAAAMAQFLGLGLTVDEVDPNP